MHSQLRERIRLMRARLDNAAPVAEIRAESQLFVTPAPVCDRLVTLAEISNRDHILEPSAGTGAILAGDSGYHGMAPEAMYDAVEINSGLVRYLRENFNGVRVQCGDFMEWQPVQYYSRIIMNPPFSRLRAGYRAVATVRCVKTPGLQRPFRSRRLCRAVACAPGIPAKRRRDVRRNAVSQTALHVVAAGPCPLLCPVPFTCLSPCRRGLIQPQPAAPVQGK